MKIRYREPKDIFWIIPFALLYVVGVVVIAGEGWRIYTFVGGYILIWFFTTFKFVRNGKGIKSKLKQPKKETGR